LVAPQQKALSNIRKLAKSNHEKALRGLQQKVQKFGYKDTDLWRTLAWIREEAPLLIHLDLQKMTQYLESDTNYRNQFETGASGGLLNTKVREKWERDLFQGAYEKAQGKDRPKYGVQNVMNDYRGVVACSQYGKSYVVLKDVRLRCTFSPEDSANLKAERLAVLDYYAHVLNEYSDAELQETLKVANSTEHALLGDSERVGKMKYKELQIHGQVKWSDHVERLVAHQDYRGTALGAKVEAVAEMWNWKFSWMDDEKKRMEREDKEKLGAAAWAKKMESLVEAGGDVEVPEGFCKCGCGRKVAPGVTRSGKPYTTCCKGCVMGFGHDLQCGQIDASKVGVGLCKNGCGKYAALGMDGKGRALTTCCRGCATSGGASHDSTCGCKPRDPTQPCKNSCGRNCAYGLARNGKAFDTCCRGCATGGAHTEMCEVQARIEGFTSI